MKLKTDTENFAQNGSKLNVMFFSGQISLVTWITNYK